MCIIAHAAKKKYLPRANVQECMKNNRSGFFMAELLEGGKRNVVRTLSEGEALSFFDKADPEHEFVMHARIPSFGNVSLDNVHGWEEDGILFCHNMSLRELDGMMKEDKWDKTDSEYFFRKIFIPLYRAFGKEAYKDGKFHPYVDKMVRFFCGASNKFLFVMPDNGIVHYGSWIADFGDKCEFSNASYRVYETRASTGYGSGFACSLDERSLDERSLDERSLDEDDYEAWYRQAEVRRTGEPKRHDGKTVFNALGVRRVLGVALRDLALRNVMQTIVFCEDPDRPKGFADALYEAIDANRPSYLDEHTSDAAAEIVSAFAKGGDKECGDALLGYCGLLEDNFLKVARREYGGIYPSDVSTIGENLDEGLEVAAALAHLSFDLGARDPNKFAVAFTVKKAKTGGFKSVRMSPEDVLCHEELDIGTTMKGIAAALAVVNSPPAEGTEPDKEKKEAEK